MIPILAALALGFILSRIITLPEKAQNFIGKLTGFAILLLLFTMGITIGANPEVMANLASLGLSAFLIAGAAITASVLAVWGITSFSAKHRTSPNSRAEVKAHD